MAKPRSLSFRFSPMSRPYASGQEMSVASEKNFEKVRMPPLEQGTGGGGNLSEEVCESAASGSGNDALGSEGWVCRLEGSPKHGTGRRLFLHGHHPDPPPSEH